MDDGQCGSPLSIETDLWVHFKVRLTTGENAKWKSRDKAAALLAVQAIAANFATETGINGALAFQQVYGYVTLKMVESYEYNGDTYTDGACACGGPNTILFASFYQTGPGYTRSSSTTLKMNLNLVVHELGHQFSYNWKDDSPANPVNMFPSGLLTENGWPADPLGADNMWRQHPSSMDGPGASPSRGEVFADMFLGWVFGEFSNDRVGNYRRQEMYAIMATKLDELIP